MKKFLFLCSIIFLTSCTLPFQHPTQVACTMEAKLCPDGSYVSRTGPNCEFAPCPGKNNNDNLPSLRLRQAGNNINPIECGDEEKICPDGTYIQRIGPNCDWPDCPEINNNTNDNNNKISAVGAGETHTVARVVDGDTIVIDTGQKVRYIGMNTPETVDPRKPVECFGQEASAKNKELVAGQTVRLVKDTSETDKYGRLLRYVYVGDTMINLELVKQGYAYTETVPPDVKYASLFTAAQHQAQAAKLGLWSACK